MPDIIIKNIEDLLNLPTERPVTHAGTTYSFGDTHGNAIALIRYIYGAGLIALENTQYQELLRIYYSTPLTHTDLINFRAIIQTALRNSTELPLNVRLRLFGDLLADRGANDIFTLIALEELKLRYPMLGLNILLSNHDKVFLCVYLNGQLFDATINRLTLEAAPCPSIESLKALLLNGVISETEVRRMFNSAYLPHLKLIDYVLGGDGRSIDVMSHAPLTLQAIERAMPAFLKPESLAATTDIYSSVTDLSIVIDRINAAFVPTVNAAGVYEFSTDIRMALTSSPDDSNILFGFIWPRLDEIKRLSHSRDATYALRFRHGHDGDPGTKVIHGIQYMSYNGLLGKLTHTQLCQISSTIGRVYGLLSASSFPSEAPEEIMQAALEATTPDELPHAVITTEAVVEVAPLTATAAAAALIHPLSENINVLKTLCILPLNKYIRDYGSFTGTAFGDRVQITIAVSRNVFRSYVINPFLRGTVGSASGVPLQLRPIEIPRIDLATELKAKIDGISSETSDLPMSLARLAAEVKEASHTTRSASRQLADMLTVIAERIEMYIMTDGNLDALGARATLAPRAS